MQTDSGATRTWIAVDWGTTHLRVMRVSAGDQTDAPPKLPKLLEERESDAGLASLAGKGRAAFAETLQALLGGWEEQAVRMCGMVGSKQGWQEIPYATIDDFAGLDLRRVQAISIDADTFSQKITIMPGVAQSAPPDVMRGEETQLLGLATQAEGQFQGLVCLPGTHCKWAHLSGFHLREFHTYMTGEIFGLLKTHSLLRHSLDAAADDYRADDFLSGVQAGHASGGWGDLFKIRSAELLQGRRGVRANNWLSGLLIGAEIGHAAPDTAMPVAIVGGAALAQRYVAALQALDYGQVIEFAARPLTILGLQHAYGGLDGAAERN